MKTFTHELDVPYFLPTIIGCVVEDNERECQEMALVTGPRSGRERDLAPLGW